MPGTNGATHPSMNEAHERDPFNNNSYGTLVDSPYKLVSLPVLDGWAFVDRCRSLPDCRDVPIVVMSATHALHETAKQLHAMGVRAVVAKPFDSAWREFSAGGLDNAITVVGMLWLKLNRDELRRRWAAPVPGGG